MKRLLRWLVITVTGMLLVCAIAYGVIYVIAEQALRRTYPVSAVALTIPTDEDSIREGERLARVRGCMDGCHGKGVAGAVLFDVPAIARVVAPNLTDALRRYDDSQFAAIVRHGVRPDGRSVVVMPSQAFGVMTDVDLARTIAFLRTLPPADGPSSTVALGPLGRIGLALGNLHTTRQAIEAAVPPPPGADAQGEFGRYLARSVCAECHGTGLRGESNPDFTSPNLRIVLAYTPEAFTDLMRRGVALGGREVGLMSAVSRGRFSHLTDDEVAALYAYLHTVSP